MELVSWLETKVYERVVLFKMNNKDETVLLDTQRVLQIDEAFFNGYRKNIVNPNEVLVSIQIPFTTEVSF